MPNAPHSPAELARVFNAPLSSDDIVSHIDTRCINLGIAPSLIARIELVLEALLAVLIRPEFGAGANDEIEIVVEPQAKGVEIRFRDNSPAFDPHLLADPEFARLCSSAECYFDETTQCNRINLSFY